MCEGGRGWVGVPRARSLDSFACVLRVPFSRKEKLFFRAAQAGQGSEGADRIVSGTTGQHGQCQAPLTCRARPVRG